MKLTLNKDNPYTDTDELFSYKFAQYMIHN